MQHIIARTAAHHIVTRAAVEEGFAAQTAVQIIIARAAFEPIHIATPEEPVVAVSAAQRVGAISYRAVERQSVQRLGSIQWRRGTLARRQCVVRIEVEARRITELICSEPVNATPENIRTAVALQSVVS